MQPSSLANTNQQVSDTSGSALNAVNGATAVAESTDATRWAQLKLVKWMVLVSMEPSSFRFQDLPPLQEAFQFNFKLSLLPKMQICQSWLT